MNSKVIITLFAVLISIPVQAPVYAQSSAGALFFDEILAKPSLEKRRAEFNKVTRPDVWKEYAKYHKESYGLNNLIQRSAKWERSVENIARMQRGKAPVGLDSKPLELHHIKPLSLNGTNHYSNLKIMTQSDHRLGKNMYRNHPDIYKLRKARYSSFKAVRNTLKYAPYAAAVASVFEVGFILNKHGFAEAFNKKEFYREITTAGAGIGSGVLASKLSAPVCIGAGTAGTPAAGAVCVVLLSVAGYYIGEKAGSQVFDIVFGKEKINEDIAKMKKAIHDEIYKTKVMPTKNK